MVLTFDIIAGKIDSTTSCDTQTPSLISPSEFEEEYQKLCTELMGKQEILKIIDRTMHAAETGLECIPQDRSVGFNGIVVEDSVSKGYNFWIDTDNVVFAECDIEIEFDIFAEKNHKLTSASLHAMIRDTIKKALFDASLQNVVCNIELS